MAREILLVLGADEDRYLSFCPHGAGRNLSRTAMLAPYKDADGELDPARVQQTLAQTTAGLDIRWFGGAPDLSESPLAYKDASKVTDRQGATGRSHGSSRLDLGRTQETTSTEPTSLHAAKNHQTPPSLPAFGFAGG
jgi:RNA-splicing ligase RtcB